MADEVSAEIGPYFADTPATDEDERKLSKLDDNTAAYVRTGLTLRWSDLDVSQHVKYIGWIRECSALDSGEPRAFERDLGLSEGVWRRQRGPVTECCLWC